MSYKSHRYSYKVHFNVSDYEHMLLLEDEPVRLSNQAYLEERELMIRFVLDKGRLLKMSLKTLHLAVYLMDHFCNGAKLSWLFRDKLLLAACSLLLAAKSGELDERVPFISKLKKYTGLDNPAEEFKSGEVAIAEALHWDIQKVTFYSFVEYYLTAGVLTPQDRVCRKVVDSLKQHGVEDTVRLLAREEQTRPRFHIDSLYGRASSSSIRDSSEALPKEDYFALCSLPSGLRADLIKVFELYARDLSNLILREFRYWSHSKNLVSVSLLIYTRSAILEHSNAWSGRLRDLSGLTTSEVRDSFSRVNDFISLGLAETPVPQEPKKEATQPLGDISANFDSKSNAASKYSSHAYQSLLEKDPKLKEGRVHISSRSKERSARDEKSAGNRRTGFCKENC